MRLRACAVTFVLLFSGSALANHMAGMASRIPHLPGGSVIGKKASSYRGPRSGSRVGARPPNGFKFYDSPDEAAAAGGPESQAKPTPTPAPTQGQRQRPTPTPTPTTPTPTSTQGEQGHGAEQPGFLESRLGVHPDGRPTGDDIHRALEYGELKNAASMLPDKGSARGWRDRRAQNRLFNEVMRQMKRRSRIGDSDGAFDANAALKIIRDKMELGTWKRFRAWWAQKRMVWNTLRAARRLGRTGNLAGAGDNVALLRSKAVLGPDHRLSRKAVRRLYRHSYKMAKHFARQGQIQQMEDAIVLHRHMGSYGAGTPNEARLARVIKLGFQRAVGALVWQARQVYIRSKRSGDPRERAEAARLLAESIEIQENKEYGYRPGWFARRQQRKLLVALGPLVRQTLDARRQEHLQQEIAEAAAEEEQRRMAEGQGGDGAGDGDGDPDRDRDEDAPDEPDPAAASREVARPRRNRRAANAEQAGPTADYDSGTPRRNASRGPAPSRRSYNGPMEGSVDGPGGDFGFSGFANNNGSQPSGRF